MSVEINSLYQQIDNLKADLAIAEDQLDDCCASLNECQAERDAAIAECQRRKGWDQDIAHWRERAEKAEAELVEAKDYCKEWLANQPEGVEPFEHIFGLISQIDNITFGWKEKLAEEKDRRVYYQDIVYKVCLYLPNGTVSGTKDNPTTEVQDRVYQMKADRDRLKAELAEAIRVGQQVCLAHDELEAELEKAEAERDRLSLSLSDLAVAYGKLRQSLQRIATDYDCDPRAEARHALKGAWDTESNEPRKETKP